jgi:CheY-like chemotaxis protein
MRGVSIFLVEDETLIRMMVVEMLKELGHRVVAEAGSIQTAEPLARSCAFDLAVFDINVAGFIISPIAEIVAARGLPFVFVSGYGGAEPRRRGLGSSAGAVALRRPFSIKASLRSCSMTTYL